MDQQHTIQRRPFWRMMFDMSDKAPVGEDDKARLRHYTVFTILGVPSLVAFGIYNLVQANFFLATMIAITSIGVFTGWMVLMRTSNPQRIFRIVAGLYFLLVLYMLALSDKDGSKILWVYTFPMITLFILGQKEGLYWVGTLAVVVVLLLWVPFDGLAIYPYHAEFKVRFVATFTIVSAITCWLEHIRSQYHEGMKQEHQRLELEKQRLSHEINERKKVQEEREALIGQLKETLEKVNTLQGLIPICAQCHSIRDDQGYWNRLEGYIQKHSDAEFSHSICPKCKVKLYPKLYSGKNLP